jgi:hypothetical protein
MFDNAVIDRHTECLATKAIVPKSRGVGSRCRTARDTNMSGPLYGARPPVPDPRAQMPASDIGVSTRSVRLEAGLFSLSLLPGPPDLGTGLPAVRVCLPPGPPGRRETVSISTLRGDGWMTVTDEATLLRVPSGGAEVVVTLYWSAADADASPPALKLARLNVDGTPTAAPAVAVPHGPVFAPPVAEVIGQGILAPPAVDLIAPKGGQSGSSPPTAEIVAHIEGVGDVDGKLGDWVGVRGSGRAIEGFSLAPRLGISAGDFAIRAVLGRDWLSPWLPGGSFCGSRGLALPLRGFCVRLLPAVAARLEFSCFARFVDGTEVGPVGNDRICAAASLAALEAFQITLRPRVA